MSSTQQLLLAEGAGGTVIRYIEQMFSTYLYTGNGSTQSISSGVDLATNGGVAWVKSRSNGISNTLSMTGLVSNGTLSTDNENAVDTSALFTGFTTTGFGVTASGGAATNSNGFSTNNYVGWSFKKQAKFFDVVTFTGTGSANQAVPHSLESVPGFIVIRKTSGTGMWPTYHRSLGRSFFQRLNSATVGQTVSNIWGTTDPTSTNFYVSNVTNPGTGLPFVESGATYIAMVFANDAGGFGLSGTDNVISCGSYTGNGSSTGPVVTLGYEPQWLLIKNATTSATNWSILDSTRVFAGYFFGADAKLLTNSLGAEAGANSFVQPTATGFQPSTTNGDFNTSGNTYVYVAIRKGPMQIPTDAATVFQPVAYTGTNVDNRLVNTGIFTDMALARIRASTSGYGFVMADRLRGDYFSPSAAITTPTVDPDSYMTPTVGFGTSFSAMNGFGVGNDATCLLNQSSTAQLAYAFKRAPQFFDEVVYRGTGVARTVSHNLGATPELIIVKNLSGSANWIVYSATSGATKYQEFNTTIAATVGSTYWNNTSPTSSVFTVGTASTTNANTNIYAAYLFATLAGISKVGTYTGTGATQTVSCGFTGGARFVLLKRTDTVGDWYVWDTARGMVAGTDPSLLINTTAAEVNANSIYTTTGGFQIVSTAAGINASGGTYIYLAIA